MEQDDLGKRQPHAVLDVASRKLKAIKIERLLELHARPQPMRMLEIGTGSGGIAHYFATHEEMKIDVSAVDVVDNRQERDGYRFEIVGGTGLPFDDQSFDVVLSNHVIEHIGDRDAQLEHLREIRRVMRESGVGYLAVPNRWMLVEPHYKLAFLSWLPERWRSPYLNRRLGKPFYDCRPLTLPAAEKLLADAEFTWGNFCVPALRQTLELEYAPDALFRCLLGLIPDRVFSVLSWLNPTLIFVLRKGEIDARRRQH